MNNFVFFFFLSLFFVDELFSFLSASIKCIFIRNYGRIIKKNYWIEIFVIINTNKNSREKIEEEIEMKLKGLEKNISSSM